MTRRSLIYACILSPALIAVAEPVKERLPLTIATPVEKRVGDRTLWDLTQTSTQSEDEASYLIYGDTILSETIDGWRRWFMLSGDTLTLCREESLRKAVVYLDTIILDGENRTTPFEAVVMDTEDNRFVRHGMHSSSALERCLLVLVPGDTVTANVRREVTDYTETPSPLLEDTDYTASEEKAYRREVISWYRNTFIPEAVMATEWSIEDGKETMLSQSCHVRDHSLTQSNSKPDTEDEDPGEAVNRIMDSMEIFWRDGAVVLMLPSPMPCPFSVDVLTDQGLPLSHREFTGDEGLLPEIHVSGPLTGRLMTVVTTPWRQTVRMLTIE